MKYVWVSLILVIAPLVQAQELFLSEVEKPYDVIVFEEDITNPQSHLGFLDDFPIMYEFTLDSPSVLSFSLRQLYESAEPIPFGIILVEVDVNQGGVKEIVRFNPQSDNWTTIKDSVLGLSLRQSDKVTQNLESGVYRLEVSTPNNMGRYILDIGAEAGDKGYFGLVSNTRITQSFFGFSIFKMLTSSLVYYPLGITILLIIIHRTWKYRKVISHDS